MKLILTVLKIIGIYFGVSILITFSFVISFLAIICLLLDYAVFLVLNFLKDLNLFFKILEGGKLWGGG